MCDKVDRDTFKVAPHAFFGWTYFVAVFMTLAVPVYFLSPVMVFVCIALSLVPMLFQFVLYAPFLDPLFDKRDSGNVMGTYSPSGEVKRRIILGSYVLSSGYYDAYYLRAQKVRTLIRRDFEKAFESVDVIMTPTSPTTAFKIGEKTSDPLAMYLSDICTINVNLAGLPGLSLPCGFASNGLPVGLQMIGKAFDEQNLLSYAYAYEQSAGWSGRNPSL